MLSSDFGVSSQDEDSPFSTNRLIYLQNRNSLLRNFMDKHFFSSKQFPNYFIMRPDQIKKIIII